MTETNDVTPHRTATGIQGISASLANDLDAVDVTVDDVGVDVARPAASEVHWSKSASRSASQLPPPQFSAPQYPMYSEPQPSTAWVWISAIIAVAAGLPFVAFYTLAVVFVLVFASGGGQLLVLSLFAAIIASFVAWPPIAAVLALKKVERHAVKVFLVSTMFFPVAASTLWYVLVRFFVSGV